MYSTVRMCIFSKNNCDSLSISSIGTSSCTGKNDRMQDMHVAWCIKLGVQVRAEVGDWLTAHSASDRSTNQYDDQTVTQPSRSAATTTHDLGILFM